MCSRAVVIKKRQVLVGPDANKALTGGGWSRLNVLQQHEAGAER